jgi:predicted ATPase
MRDSKMITQIEIDGFKTFKDFKVELAPFQVIVGANASGKSNLFDALQLLSRLATYEVSTAFLDLRGNPLELFTKLPDGTRIQSMHFAVEMLLDRHMQDDLGQKVELQHTRLRYELEITFDEKDELLYVTEEILKTIPSESDAWVKKYEVSSELLPVNDEVTYIETKRQQVNNQNYVTRIYTAPLPDVFMQLEGRRFPRTMLSWLIGAPSFFLPISAARQEMRNWRFIHLNPDELRKSSSVGGSRFLSPQGGNLPTMLARLQKEDKIALDSISRDVAYLVPGIYKVEVSKNLASAQHDLSLETLDHRIFSANVLSDGTLRLLALATLKNDLQLHGTLCLEEPENGVNPLALGKMARLLRILATDFHDTEQLSEPLTQVLITTQSPLFASQPEVKDALLYAFIVTRISPRSGKNTSLNVTSMVPVVTSDEATTFAGNEPVSRAVYTIDKVLEYLADDNLNTIREELEKARDILNER